MPKPRTLQKIDELNTNLGTKANQTDLNTTNANLALKADKSEVANVLTPKGNSLYASLPTTGNTVGWYWYCSDGDGTHGAGNYVWNGTSFYFGGTGDEGYNILKNDLNAVAIRKNLVTEVIEGYIRSNNSGKVSNPWQNASYNCARANVEGLDYVSFNYDWASNSFSFFSDANGNIIGTKVEDYRQTSYGGFIYSVPSGAVYLYFSANVSTYATYYNSRGFVCFHGTENINSDSFTTTAYPIGGTKGIVFADKLGMSNGYQNLGEYLAKIATVKSKFYCYKDGTGDFTKLTDAINYVNNNNIMDATIYVGAGTWNIIDELGSEYVETVSTSKRGLYLKNRAHLIFSSESIVTCKYTGTTANTIEWLSAFNMGQYGATLENATIESDNVRYSVHDEYGYEASTPYINKYINCHMKHTNGKYINCIGGGLGIDGYIEIRGCYFEGNATSGNNRLVYYHGNNELGKISARSRLEVHDNYFAGLGTFGVTTYGDSTEVSKAFVSNNSVGSAVNKNIGSYAPNDNIELIGWNNAVRV